MTVMERSRTEERIDELTIRVDEGFAEVDRRFGDVDRRFAEIDKRFEQIDRRFERVEEDGKEFRIEVNREFVALRGEIKEGFDRLHRTMLGFCGSLLVAVLAFVFTH